MLRWRGPVHATATSSDNPIIQLTSDVETGEFAFEIDLTMSTVMCLVQIMSADETTVHVHVWGTTSKNHLAAKYRPVMILNSTDQPTTRPRKKQQCRAWTWKILVSTVDDLLVLQQAVVLPSGKIATETKRRIRDLPSAFSFRKFVS